MRLKDKVAIVTGAGSGIGQAIAHALAKDGAIVVIGDINQEGADKAAADINKAGGKALAIKADISKEDEVRLLVETTINNFGRVDVLVNNAAHPASIRLFHETDVAEWNAEMGTKFMGAVLCCKAVIPHMLKQNSGRIISICSVAGKLGFAGRALYSASNAAIAGFSRALARELATKGITVNCVSPGPVNTLRVTRQSQSTQKYLASAVPMGRMGEPEDIANMVAFLASDDANYITGQDYSVDGGLAM